MISGSVIKKQVAKFEKYFITKNEFNSFKKEFFQTRNKFNKDHKNLINSVDFRFLNVLESIYKLSKELADFKREMMDFKDHMYKTLDFLVGSYKKFDEEHSILTTRYSTIGKTIDNHEKRISLLEKN